MNQQAITIRSEEDAYQLLQQLVDKTIDIDDRQLSFDGWPTLTLRLQGAGYQSTITPPLMKAFIELQSGIYRSYALARYNSPRVNLLTAQERDMLQIMVRVEAGSSLFKVDFQALLEAWGKELIGKVDAKTLMTMVLGVAVIWGGQTSYSNYLDSRVQERQIQAKSEEQRALVEQLKFAQEQETKRAELMANVVAENTRLHTIAAYADEAKTALVKRGSAADSVEIQGIEIEGDVAAELVKNVRSKAYELRLDGMYRIISVDSSNPTEFKVRVKCQQTGEVFTAKVEDRTLERKYLEALKNGEWSRKPVRLQINAKSLNETIKDAVVIKAEFPET